MYDSGVFISSAAILTGGVSGCGTTHIIVACRRDGSDSTEGGEMNERTLNEAISEAERFLKKASLLKEVIAKTSLWNICGCKESAAVKRSSMDLTRVLADLRQGR